ncbi:Methionine aminotransferase [Spatholobus suberectus]|nr:Methionine aminotransferase [Spatholobus suberectus]
MLGLINPEEVILFAPYYDSYLATLSMVGAKVKGITLHPPDFSVPIEELKSTMLKVYDKLAYDMDHVFIASLLGMFERIVTMNSLGKIFSLIGWKIGWAIAPPHLTWGVRQTHAFLTFASTIPMQWAATATLRTLDSNFVEPKRGYMAKMDILVERLKDIGFRVFPPSGTYFVIMDHTPFVLENDVTFYEYLIKEVGVAAIPINVFYLNSEEEKNLVRFIFYKDEGTLKVVVERMKDKLKRK